MNTTLIPQVIQSKEMELVFTKNYDSIIAEMEKIKKNVEAAGLPFEYTVTPAEVADTDKLKNHLYITENGNKAVFMNYLKPFHYVVKFNYPTIVVDSGYSMYAFIDKDNMVFGKMDNNSQDIDFTDIDKKRCDHCQKTIYRNNVVIAEKNGKLFQFGEDCATKFLGFDVLLKSKWFKQLFTITKQVGGNEESISFGRGYSDYGIELPIIAKYILAVKKLNEPKERAYIICNAMFDGFRHTSEATIELYTKCQTLFDDESFLAEVADIVEGVKQYYASKVATKSYNLYELNVNTVFKKGLLASSSNAKKLFYSAIYYYQRVYDYKGMAIKTDAPSDFVGTVNEKILLELTLNEIKQIIDFMGRPSNVYKLTDNKGNIFVKYGTIPERLIKEQTVKANFEIIKHLEATQKYPYRQTQLGRATNPK